MSILCNSFFALLCVPHVGVITGIVTMLWDVILFLLNNSDDQIFRTLSNLKLCFSHSLFKTSLTPMSLSCPKDLELFLFSG